MHFKEEGAEQFLKIFDQHKVAIRQVEGCTHLELLKDLNQPFSYATLSYWRGAVDLENYRNSDLFKSVWSQVKVLFSSSPEAISLESLQRSADS